jgi:hypothetical protein
LLEFRDGISSRPILSTPIPDAIPPDGGTRVEIRLRWDPRVAMGITLDNPATPDFSCLFGGKKVFLSLSELVGWIAPAAPVSIDAVQFKSRKRAVTANDWLTISSADLVTRIGHPFGSSQYFDMIRPIPNDRGDIVGRAALVPNSSFNRGILVAGGLRIGVSQLVRHTSRRSIETRSACWGDTLTAKGYGAVDLGPGRVNSR